MDYPIQPIPFNKVKFQDDFWTPRLETSRQVTIPYDFQKCEETGRIDNFAKAAKHMDGPHVGIFYNDSDVFKVIEGAAYSQSLNFDPQLDAYLDDLIELIAAAQESDGYLYTARTIDPSAVTADREGSSRWSNLKVSHELYNIGHLYEAAVAHFQATGKRTLLEVALKSADLVDGVFGPGKKRDVPGHQEIEMGLVKLYRITGNQRYLQLAKFFLDERGHANGRELYENYDDVGYMQDHLPVTEQKEAVGHAVRAVYMYSGMADVAALTGEQDYLPALDALWHDVVSRKMYLTGGIGARHKGEAFGEAYELPNAAAYAETCAAIANIMWNHRMFLLHGNAKYIDVLERVLYNGFLSGVSLDGRTFFYPNPLESDGKWKFNRGQAATRSPWFDCSCCPTNVVRLLASLPGYVYAVRDDKLYVNLFVASSAEVNINDTVVQVAQKTQYPWQGTIRLTVKSKETTRFTLAVRIPAWAQGKPVPTDLYRYLETRQNDDPAVDLKVNGQPIVVDIQDGYAQIDRAWEEGDIVEITLPMQIHRVISHENIEDNKGKVAVELGPLVYCAEQVDNDGQALSLILQDHVQLNAEYDEAHMGGIVIIKGENITLIPYYAWSHRGEGEMVVWLRR